MQTIYDKPDFLGIGAMRSGSSWLHYNLQKHPQIFMPNIKELHYFDKKKHGSYQIRLGFDNVRYLTKIHLKSRQVGLADARYYANYFFLPRSDAWYVRNFADMRGKRIAGEITPAYSILSDSEIAEINIKWPHLKILLLIRNPVERAWSHIVKSLARNHKVNIDSVDDGAIRCRLDDIDVLSKGDYVAIIDTWTKYYGKDQLFVGFYDQIGADPHGLLRDVCAFLGVDYRTEYFKAADVGRRVNNTDLYKSLIPLEIQRHLYHTYRDVILEIAARYGSYAVGWQERVEVFCAGARGVHDA